MSAFTHKNIALIYSGYLMGYLSSEQVIALADKDILAGNVDDYLLSISLSKNDKNIILSELRTTYQKQGLLPIHSLYFSLYNRLLRYDEQTWFFLLGELIRLKDTELMEPDDDRDLFFSCVCDYIGLLRSRLATNMDMPEDLTEFLSPYNENIQIFKDLGFKVNGFDITLL